MNARKPLLDALVSMLTPRDVLVSCLGANARYLPHMKVPSPVFALCDSMGAAVPLALGIALQRPEDRLGIRVRRRVHRLRRHDSVPLHRHPGEFTGVDGAGVRLVEA